MYTRTVYEHIKGMFTSIDGGVTKTTLLQIVSKKLKEEDYMEWIIKLVETLNEELSYCEAIEEKNETEKFQKEEINKDKTPGKTSEKSYMALVSELEKKERQQEELIRQLQKERNK